MTKKKEEEASGWLLLTAAQRVDKMRDASHQRTDRKRHETKETLYIHISYTTY